MFKIILYLLTTVITCREIRILTSEIEASPLFIVDENMTEELYKNILQQSKNPDDNELVQQYHKISEDIKEKKRKTDKEQEGSSRNNLTLEENSTSEIFCQKVLDSINLNVSERLSDISKEYKDFSSKITINFYIYIIRAVIET